MKESTTYQAILREGLAEGRAEGRVEGTLAEARRILIMLGETHIGPLDATTRAALENITDVDTLEAMSVRLLKASSWQELLARPAPRRRNGRRRSDG